MVITVYDLRGILNKDLNWEIIYSVVKNFLKDIGSSKILLASDFNKNNLKIQNFLEKNFLVENLGILPTPIFYYQVIKRKLPGIMVTASHLPLKYSGLKFLRQDGTSWKVPPLDNSVRGSARSMRQFGLRFASAQTFSHGLPESRSPRPLTLNSSHKFAANGDVRISSRESSHKFATTKEIYNDYFRKLKSIIRPKRKIFVEFDLNNFFLRTSLPYFQIIKIFHKKNAQLKIKSDFDNDRIYLYYKNRQILPDLIFYFLALKKKYQKLGVPIYFSQKLQKLLLEKNKKIYFIRTGHIYFKEAFKKHKLDLAFEPSGHFYLFRDLKTEGPYLALSMFLHQIENIEDFLQKIKITLYRFNLPLSPKFSLEKLAFSFKKIFKLKLKKFDGYFLTNQNFCLHFRQSLTENKLRVSFEGNKKYLPEIKQWFKKL